ncbi:MAG: hypothetical protein NVS2B9_03050 [Myxococcales bacterium]
MLQRMPSKPPEPLSFRVLESFESVIYLVIAALLLAIAISILGYGIFSLVRNVGGGFLGSAINLINEILLVLIVLELLRTVLSFARGHVKPNVVASLVPFLVIAAISASRRVLAIGAWVSVEEGHTGLEPRRFQQAMIELGVSGGLVLAIGVTLVILRAYASVERETPHPGGDKPPG